ncbi:MAG TPA: hypothetical protein VMR98_04100 [Candidatus Polarisedimenticolaceae bacterium]|nr:hypothetical protein [Candidatus Polarisedimenticolaceae bacterium]
MARKVKRRVKRNSGGRRELVRSITERRWYELPDWAVAWLVKHAGRVVLAMVLLLSPIALLAIVLGSHSLPLHFIGIAGSDNALGLKAVMFMLTFGLLAFAIKPLMRGLRRGWWLVILAAAIHMADNLLSDDSFSGIVLLAIAMYAYVQVRHRLD